MRNIPDTDELFQKALRMVAPGTKIREALSAIIQSGMGALLCFGEPRKLSQLSEGGVELNEEAKPQLIYELSKMDGAIILNSDGTRILYANRFLKPNAKIPSDETGTRHRVAQRMAQQANCIVVAVSQRRSTVTLYVKERKHVLSSLNTLMNKAMQSLQTIEKFLVSMNHSLQDLTMREFQEIVTIYDVCKTIQRTQVVLRLADELKPMLLELGTEGRLLQMQIKELLIPIPEAELVIKDYYKERMGFDYNTILQKIRDLSQEELVDLGNISQILGYGANLRAVDMYLVPRGYRILTMTHRLPTMLIENLVAKFTNLTQILHATREELMEVEGIGDVLAERIKSSLNLLRSQMGLEFRR
ncbi:MAG: DNA integrity scanning diadenylate cyclase DisA [Candidatus Hydrogenedentes bacterium]|nr:DNA integrity scanning diadenylate cyclase DisA [Candidatus Hydrogenedentota bacterium]